MRHVQIASPSYRVELADLGRDAAALDALWNRNFGGEPVQRSQRYLDNPAGPGAVWKLRSGAGSLVGAAGGVDRPFRIGDRECVIAQAVNLAIEPEHRSAGPALMLSRALVGAARPMTLAITRNASAVFARVGYRTVGAVERWVKPLRSERYLRRQLGSRGLARAAAAAGDVMLRLVSRETWQRPRGITTALVHGFDARFDALWSRAARCLDVACVRDATALHWRFRDARTLGILDRAGALIGYAIYRLDDGYALIEDVLWADRTALDAVLAELLRHVRQQREVHAVAISYFGSPELPARLRAFGFQHRPDTRSVFVYQPRDAALAIPLDPARWYLTAADLEL